MDFTKTIEKAVASRAEAERRIRDEAEILHTDLDLTRRAYLVLKGMPFDIALKLSAAEITAWTVAFGEAEGGRWDWRLGAWARV